MGFKISHGSGSKGSDFGDFGDFGDFLPAGRRHKSGVLSAPADRIWVPRLAKYDVNIKMVND